ncbi:YceI family protein [Oceanimonas pelagia]|uniref:YceI family protein n=1 Tax=Oceanimonas pelagia TaxID=3028314 RepID=A0AA50QBU7_9GAMM|nr:YceI family protein [Oceanimonas pelagia]WMC10612.1 YceI family protein [Oceanimonas pelagia]
MKKTLIATALLAASTTPAFAAVENYTVDTQGMHASINFKINHLGYSWIVGRFNDFNGSFAFDEDNAANNRVEMTVNTASIDTNHGERDRHLRSDDFLDVSKFPEASFRSTSVIQDDDEGEYVVKGELTLHGVTRPVEFEIEQVGAGEDPWGGFRRGFEGELELKLTDYGIDYDLGPASATVYLDIHLEGVRQ